MSGVQPLMRGGGVKRRQYVSFPPRETPRPLPCAALAAKYIVNTPKGR